MEKVVNQEYAPILIVVYDRLTHLQKCIESLLNCKEAKSTDLYIASDSAYQKCDEDKVKMVREYIQTIKGFKSINPIIRKKNLGAIENFESAKKFIYKKHDNLIQMEDDVIVGNGFLNFMNSGLGVYKNSNEVVAICGYLPPNIDKLSKTPFFLNRLAPYGWGSWKLKENMLLQYRNSRFIDKCLKDYHFFKKYHLWSPNYVRALPLIIQGGMSFHDIETGVVMQKKNLLALYPPTSITKSTGHDGTGLHSGTSIELQNQTISNHIYKIHDLKPQLNEEIMAIRGRYNKNCCVFLLNISIFIMNKYFPKVGYFFFSRIRKLVRRFK